MPAPNAISATPAASASLTHGDLAADRLANELPASVPIHDWSTFAAVRATPFFITAGNVAPVGPVQSKNLASSPTTPVDRVGRGRVRGEDAVAVGEQLAAAGVDGRALDAGAADVDAEHCGHGVILARFDVAHATCSGDTGG